MVTWSLNILVHWQTKIGHAAIYHAQNIEVTNMSENEQPVININLDKFTGKMSDIIEQKFLSLEEKLTPAKESKGLVERLNSPKEIKEFDWKRPIEELLLSFKESDYLNADSYKIGNKREKVDSIVSRRFDKVKRETVYDLQLTEALVETIGTIAQGGNNCAIPEIWSDKIERDHVYPGSVFLGAWFVNWYTDIEGKPGDKVYIPRVGPALCADMSCDCLLYTSPSPRDRS